MADDKDNKDNPNADRVEALDTAVERENARTEAAGDRVDKSVERQKELRETAMEPADVDPAKATDFEASGAVVEPQHKKAIDVDHPAVDNNPRENTTARQNQIDFNDPTLNDRQAVEQRLDGQS